MAKKIKDIKLTDFPEEVDEQSGVKIYSETSYENHLAILSQFLHNGEIEENEGDATNKKNAVIKAIQQFLEEKKELGEDLDEEITEDFVGQVAEEPARYFFFRDFFEVPFPDPEQPRFTFIDLFAGMGGFRIAMQRQGGKCVFSSEWNKYAHDKDILDNRKSSRSLSCMRRLESSRNFD